MKFCKCQNLNSLFREISFLELPKYSWNLQMLSPIEKFKEWKILLKKYLKIGTTFGRWSLKIGAPLASRHNKLKNWHAFGLLASPVEKPARDTFIYTLSRKNEKLAHFWKLLSKVVDKIPLFDELS